MSSREKSALIQLRATPAQKQVIVWAAEAQGVSITEFMLNAALHRAYQTVDLAERKKDLVKLAASAQGLSEKDFKDRAVLDLALKVLHDDT